MRLIGISDIHASTRGFRTLAPELAAADLILLAGDITTNGGSERMRTVMKALDLPADKIIAVHGNMDTKDAIVALNESATNIHACGITIGNIGFMGLGGSNRTPMHTPTEYNEIEIERFLNEGLDQLEDPQAVFVLSHTPPRGTLDRAFHLLHVGSPAVRDFLLRTQPLLCLCGHIHEARGLARIDRTIVANPGRFSAGHYIDCTIHFDGKNVVSGIVSLMKFTEKRRSIVRSMTIDCPSQA